MFRVGRCHEGIAVPISAGFRSVLGSQSSSIVTAIPAATPARWSIHRSETSAQVCHTCATMGKALSVTVGVELTSSARSDPNN